MSSYVYDQAWDRERQRLAALEGLFGEITHQRLAAVGVDTGWRVLEVGAGSGGTARWLADRVGPTGSVVATDLDPRFLEPAANLEVRRHDILADPLEPASYDLVHARALLEHLPGRHEALRRMVAAARPGGWVVVEDFHLDAAADEMLARYFSPAEEVDLLRRVTAALGTLMRGAGADMAFAAQLPAALTAAGLTDVGAAVAIPMAGGGERSFLALGLAFLGDRVVAAGQVTRDEVDRLVEILGRPDTFHATMPLVSAWGRRPA